MFVEMWQRHRRCGFGSLLTPNYLKRRSSIPSPHHNTPQHNCYDMSYHRDHHQREHRSHRDQPQGYPTHPIYPSPSALNSGQYLVPSTPQPRHSSSASAYDHQESSSHTSHNDPSRAYIRRANDNRSNDRFPLNAGHQFIALAPMRGALEQISESSTPQGIVRNQDIYRDEHDPRRRYSCNLCSRRFDRPSALETHKRSHTEDLPFVCPECTKGFNVKSNMTRHRVRVHGIEDRGHRASPGSSSSDRSTPPYAAPTAYYHTTRY